MCDGTFDRIMAYFKTFREGGEVKFQEFPGLLEFQESIETLKLTLRKKRAKNAGKCRPLCSMPPHCKHMTEIQTIQNMSEYEWQTN